MKSQNINQKNKKGSNGTEPNQLKPDYNNYNKQKYLNVSIDIHRGCAGMAERSTQLVNTQSSFRGHVGLIPTPSATFSNKSILGVIC